MKAPDANSEPELDNLVSREPAPSRILDERFLVEHDISDASLGGGYSVFIVKDLKDFCRRRTLKITNFVPDELIEAGPTFHEVCGALKTLNHPHIEKIEGIGCLSDDRPFAVTDAVSGTTLDQIVADCKRLDLDRIARILDQTAAAIAAAHSKGIVHCDLRPSNIAVSTADDGAELVRVINFGSAWPVDARGESLCNVQPGCESLHYAAPEMLVTLCHRSRASDIYSFAVLAYRLITGYVPFAGRDRVTLLELINAASMVRPSHSRTDLSAEAEALILAGLQFEPALRPPDIEDYAISLIRAICPPLGLAPAETMPGIENSPPPTPVAPAAPEALVKTSFPRHTEPSAAAPAPAVSDRAIAWALIILLTAGALSIPIGQSVLSGPSEAAAISTMAERPPQSSSRHRLSYRLEFTPETGPGELSFTSDPAGEMYVIGESEGDDGRPSFELIYPVAGSAEGMPKAVSGHAVTAALRTLRQPKALWLVWTAARNAELAAVLAGASGGQVLSEVDGRRLRHFLERSRNMRLNVSSDPATGQTVLEGSRDKIVHRIELGEG